MKIGMTGLGRMGFGMRERLRRGGIEVVGFDVNPDVRDVDSLEDMVVALVEPHDPTVVWMMLPLGPIASTLDTLAEILSPGDIIVDGGNSNWKDTQARSARFAELGIGYVDVGTSNGIWGNEHGYGLMVGGEDEHVAFLRPVFDALTPETGGFSHAGPSGAGQYAKAIHNAIEYVMMQGIAEGYEMLAASPLVTDPAAVFAGWQEGTVIRSFLTDLAARALAQDEGLASLRGVAADSGEGRWTLAEAIELRVPVPGLSAALFARFASQQEDSPAMKMVAALRNQFGGHAVVKAAE